MILRRIGGISLEFGWIIKQFGGISPGFGWIISKIGGIPPEFSESIRQIGKIISGIQKKALRQWRAFLLYRRLYSFCWGGCWCKV